MSKLDYHSNSLKNQNSSKVQLSSKFTQAPYLHQASTASTNKQITFDGKLIDQNQNEMEYEQNYAKVREVINEHFKNKEKSVTSITRQENVGQSNHYQYPGSSLNSKQGSPSEGAGLMMNDNHRSINQSKYFNQQQQQQQQSKKYNLQPKFYTNKQYRSQQQSPNQTITQTKLVYLKQSQNINQNQGIYSDQKNKNVGLPLIQSKGSSPFSMGQSYNLNGLKANKNYKQTLQQIQELRASQKHALNSHHQRSVERNSNHSKSGYEKGLRDRVDQLKYERALSVQRNSNIFEDPIDTKGRIVELNPLNKKQYKEDYEDLDESGDNSDENSSKLWNKKAKTNNDRKGTKFQDQQRRLDVADSYKKITVNANNNENILEIMKSCKDCQYKTVKLLQGENSQKNKLMYQMINEHIQNHKFPKQSMELQQVESQKQSIQDLIRKSYRAKQSEDADFLKHDQNYWLGMLKDPTFKRQAIQRMVVDSKNFRSQSIQYQPQIWNYNQQDQTSATITENGQDEPNTKESITQQINSRGGRRFSQDENNQKIGQQFQAQHYNVTDGQKFQTINAQPGRSSVTMAEDQDECNYQIYYNGDKGETPYHIEGGTRAQHAKTLEDRAIFRNKLKQNFEQQNSSKDFLEFLLLKKNPLPQTSVIKNKPISPFIGRRISHGQLRTIISPTSKQQQPLGDPVIKGNVTHDSEFNTKFYDYLMAMSDKHQLLNSSIKEITRPTNFENTHDTKLEFLKQCVKENTVPLSTAVVKIVDNSFELINYQLNEGLVRSICTGLPLHQQKLTQIYLSNNFLTDDQLAQILKCLDPAQQLPSIKSLILSQKNVVGSKTVEIIRSQFLSKVFPNELEELRIVHCKVQSGIISSILNDLAVQCSLRKLALPKCKLGDHCVDQIVNIITKSAPNLIELDLSFNEFRSALSMDKLLHCLNDNTRLQDLNLSWNEVKPICKVEPLVEFIKTNTRLLHLDLSNMFKCGKHIKKIIRGVKKSRSLLAVHLSNTPLLGQGLPVYKFVQKKLHFRPVFEQPARATNSTNNNSTSVSSPRKNLHTGSWKEQYSINIASKITEQELTFHNHKRMKPTSSQKQDQFVLQRVIGHPEIMGNCMGSQWLLGKECYICGRWLYTLFCHQSKDAAEDDDEDGDLVKNQGNVLGNLLQRQHLQKKINESIFDEKIVTMQGTYQGLASSKNMRMINALKFTADIDPNFKEPEQILQENMEVMSHDQIAQIEQNAALKGKKIDKIKLEIHADYSAKWKQILEGGILKFKHIQMIPGDAKFDICNDNTFLYADFVKPSHMVESVQASRKKQDLFFPKVRKEEFQVFLVDPPAQREKKQQQVTEVFANVFQDWKVDTEKTYDQIIEHDAKYWKLNRFIKDAADAKAVEGTIRNHMKVLKNVFNGLICKSGYPNITWLDFADYIKNCSMVDKNLPLATIDRLFIATNVELEDMGENPDRALCRFEFFEVLVRMAGAKFKEAKITSNYNEALIKLLSDNIFNSSNNSVQELMKPDQDFRDQQLWTRDVNLVLDVNKESIQKLYKKCKGKDSQMSMKQAHQLVMRDVWLGLSERDVTYCFGISKMTIKNEMEQGLAGYDRLSFVEFLEFIGRVAHTKYEDSDEPLYIKIEKVLDDLLPLVGCYRVDMQRQIYGDLSQSNSDSDDDDEKDDNVGSLSIGGAHQNSQSAAHSLSEMLGIRKGFSEFMMK